MDALFALTSTLVLPFWLAMIFAPTWRWTRRILGSLLPAAAFAAVYAVLVLPRLPELLPLLMRPSLQPIASLLATPEGATIAWVHFLAFDLFVGRWAYLDSRARGINAWLMAPVLVLILLVGPVGLLAYLGLRQLFIVGVAGPTDPRPLLARLRGTNAPLTVVGLIMLATLLGTLVGLVVDPRVITGAPAWLKPTKFAVSTAIYAFTFVWLLGFVRGHPRLVSAIGSITAAGLFIEVAIIVLQVVRGTTSHFNFSTPLDGALFSAMAVIIAVVWLMALLTAILLPVQRIPEAPVFVWSLRLGLLIALVGMAVAFFMPQPTPDQRAALAAGARWTIIGAHSVGVVDGGPGLPIVGWSTLGGDLRVPHFFGLHGLQVLPLIGWLLARQTVVGSRHAVGLIWLAGVTYLGVVVMLTWQALRGQSVVAPDAVSLAALSTLFGIAILAAAAIAVHARVFARQTPPMQRSGAYHPARS